MRPIYLILAILSIVLLTGCGGGSKKSRSQRGLAAQRSLANARLTHATFGVAGLSRLVPFPGATRKASRAHIFHTRAAQSRVTDSDYDPETAYYVTAHTDGAGAGRMDLFTDSARALLSGALVWPEPQWEGGVLGSYPATMNMDFQITAGDLAGNSGKVSITRLYADIDQGTIHVELHSDQGERVEADFTFDGESCSGTQQGWFPDGSYYTQTDEPLDEGGMWSEVFYPDGSHSTVESDDSGAAEQYYYDSSGNEYLSGVYENYGDLDVTFYDDTDVFIDDTDYDDYDDWDNYDDSQWYDDSDYSSGDDGSDDDYQRRGVKRAAKVKHIHKLAKHRGMKFEVVKASRAGHIRAKR